MHILRLRNFSLLGPILQTVAADMRPLRAGLLLSRAPIITQEPPAFAKAYYKYMDALERRLMWTFPAYFYFKRGTLAQRRFDELQNGPIPRHRGVYYPRGIPDVKHNRERREKQVINLPRSGSSDNGESSQEGDAVNTRARYDPDTDADHTSLARKLDQKLYLFVNNAESAKEWRLPAFAVEDADTSLHEAAERGLRNFGGVNINTWTVSNTPAAVLRPSSGPPEFLIRSHVLHGQLSPSDGSKYAWLTPSEAEMYVTPQYYAEIKDLL